MVEPTDAAADQEAVTSALDKLADLEVTGVAATKAENHARLEVDDKQGYARDRQARRQAALDAFIGTYQSGNSMLRVRADHVATVRGSIRYVFNKFPREWRDRIITKVEPKDVQQIVFDNKNGHFEFVRMTATTGNRCWPSARSDRPLDDSKVKGSSAPPGLNAVDFADRA